MAEYNIDRLPPCTGVNTPVLMLAWRRYIFQKASSVSPEVEKAVATFNSQIRKRKESPAVQANGLLSPPPNKVARGNGQASPQSDAAIKLAQHLKACEKVGLGALVRELGSFRG